ncbi:MAG TPA: alkaline phosphatase family protein [Chloroflexota bacterium]|jgi:hypothetical protein|nr:alkaline phosphatase family protein [Chloroflexota bacterium]
MQRTGRPYLRRTLALLTALCGSALLTAWPTVVRGQSTTVPPFSHIFLIVEENAEAYRVLENSERYVTRAAPQYSLATQYFAISHPSLPNYVAMVSGDTFGITSDCADCFLNQPNLADQIEASGRTWRAYAESMPGPCFVGAADRYAQTHNPFIYFDSIRTQPERCANGIVPFSQFAADLAQHQVPDFSMIIPDLCSDGHDCSWQAEDQWLAQLVPSILSSPEFQTGGLLVITWDEGSTNASCCNGIAHGGQVATLIISPLARTGFRSDAVVSHYSLLRTIEDAWGLPPLGHAADVSPITDVFDLTAQ